MNNDLKPMLDVDEMINELKKENVKFNIVSEEEAKVYLIKNNDYYNIISYKNNFERHIYNGKFIEKYVDLEFAYLKDIAIIDYELRRLIFRMTIDIEHYLKVRILNTIKTIKVDSYEIVNKYLEKDFNDTKFPRKLHNSILNKIGSEQYKLIYTKYDINKDKRLENIPVWEFMEIITFGELVNFYELFIKEYHLSISKDDIYMLRGIVKLRNAVAHNTNILSDLGIKDNQNNPPYKIVKYLDDCGIGKNIRNNKLTNSRIRQITFTLYMFNEIVTSDDVKNVVREKINKFFFERINFHKEYYNNNELLKSVYKYFEKIIHKYYNIDKK